jgi:hypothetical protein
MTSDAGAVRRGVEACQAIVDEYRERAALYRLKGMADEALEQDHYADVADRCAAKVEEQR